MPSSDQKRRIWLDRLEREARNHPRRHAVRLWLLVMLGYGVPVAVIATALAVFLGILALVLSVESPTLKEGFALYFVVLLMSFGIAALAVRAFWIELPDLDGLRLGDDQALPLRALVAEVADSVGAPPIHHIYIDTNLNAGVSHRRRFGLWGRRTNLLIIGAPMLLAMTPEQFRVVLAHEMGHVLGRHDSFSAWVYRIHRAWELLAVPAKNGRGTRWLLMGWFIRRYSTHLSFGTLALRRLHEYSADRLSAKHNGAEQAAAMLMAIEWWDYRLKKTFWPTLLCEAAVDPVPPRDMMDRMVAFLATEPHRESLDRWRQHALRSRTPITAAHPCLVDRLASLDCLPILEVPATLAATMPLTIDPSASAASLLGDDRERILTTASAAWNPRTGATANKASPIGGWTGPRAKFLLSGLITCVSCGSRYEGYTQRSHKRLEDGSRVKTFYYACGGYIRKGKSVCSLREFARDTFESTVVSAVIHYHKRFLGKDGRERLAEAASASVGAKQEDVTRDRKAAERELGQIGKTIQNLLDNITASNREFVDQRLIELSKQRDSIQAKIDSLAHLAISESELREVVSDTSRFVTNLEAVLNEGELEHRQMALRRCVRDIQFDHASSKASLTLWVVPAMSGWSESAASECLALDMHSER